MKNLILFSFSIISCALFSQVGISNSANYNPPAGVDLSIDGSMTVRNRIYTGGTSTTLGNPGRAGQVLVSQGPNLPPLWRTLNIPDIELNSFYLIYNNSFTDYRLANGTVNPDPGVEYPSADVGVGTNGPFNVGLGRNSATGFRTITGLNKQFEVFSNQNQVYVTFETVAQLNTTTTGQGVEFVCGIFIGRAAQGGNPAQEKTLRAIRKSTLFMGSANHPFVTFTLIGLADGLTIGLYDVEVACKRTANFASYTGTLGIGTSVQTNLNDFISQNSLKVEVYEIPQVFGGIIDLTNP